MERESEFDAEDEDRSIGDNLSDISDIELDVEVTEKTTAYCSSDEEMEDDHFLEFIPFQIDQIQGSADQFIRENTVSKTTIPELGIADQRSKSMLEKIQKRVVGENPTINLDMGPTLGIVHPLLQPTLKAAKRRKEKDTHTDKTSKRKKSKIS